MTQIKQIDADKSVKIRIICVILRVIQKVRATASYFLQIPPEYPVRDEMLVALVFATFTRRPVRDET